MTKRRKSKKTKVAKVKTLELFKATAQIDIMVMASTQEEADQIANEQVDSEIEYLKCHSVKVANIREIPSNWVDSIPYYPQGETIQDKKCSELVSNGVEAVVATPVTVEEIPVEPNPEPVPEPIRPPVRPQAPMPNLNFNIPPRRK